MITLYLLKMGGGVLSCAVSGQMDVLVILLDGEPMSKQFEAGCGITLPEEGSDSRQHTGGFNCTIFSALWVGEKFMIS